MKSFNNNKLLLIGLLLICLSSSIKIANGKEEEIKWTSNPDTETDNPALPLSMNQRRTLLELHETIRTSPNPEETLERVAEGNGISSKDLWTLLEKNYHDVNQGAGAVGPDGRSIVAPGLGSSVPAMIVKSFTSIGIIISQMAKKHPKMFSICFVSLILIVYAMITVPTTGLHISSNEVFLLSHGPTTVFLPSSKYIQKLVNVPAIRSIPLSIPTTASTTKGKDKRNNKFLWDDLMMLDSSETDDDDGLIIHKLPKKRKSELIQAMSFQNTVSSSDFISDDDDDGNYDNEEEEAEEDENMSSSSTKKIKRDISRKLFHNVFNILLRRKLTEFTSSAAIERIVLFPPIKNYVDDDDDKEKKHGILMVPKLGDYGRYGLIYYRITREMKTDNEINFTLTTLKGKGFFDGQIHVNVLLNDGNDDEDSSVSVSTHILIPKRGRKVSKRIGGEIVTQITQSIVTSMIYQTEQTLARLSQGKRYKFATSNRARERRNSRHEREKLIEEMAQDRRRKWQRGNPDAGRYRPSGHRQRSPNNC